MERIIVAISLIFSLGFTLAPISQTLVFGTVERLAPWQIPASQGTSYYKKSLSDLNPGIYFLKAENFENGYKENRKLILVK